MKDKLDPRLQRVRAGKFASNDSYGRNGAFYVTGPKGRLQIIASDQAGWEHVSACPVKNNRTPTWEEMAFVKSLFWNEDEAVVEYHPPKSRYVNNHPYVLHLWKPIDIELPLPPVYMVGIPNFKVTRVIPTAAGAIMAGVDQ